MAQISGAPLSQYVASLTLLDNTGAAITTGSAAVVITDATGAVVLASTPMPQVGSTGVYAYTVPAALYVAGGRLLHTMTGKDVGGTVVATRRVTWTDSGA